MSIAFANRPEFYVTLSLKVSGSVLSTSTSSRIEARVWAEELRKAADIVDPDTPPVKDSPK